VIYIRNTVDIFTPSQAKKFLREHVVISRADLKKIEKLARRAGIYRKLKALDIVTRDLTASRDEE
jgi:hypothetical protein